MLPLAVFLRKSGARVLGSDRSNDQGKLAKNFDSLKRIGIEIFPQDGSGVAEANQLVVSTAVEETIPDVRAAISGWHRTFGNDPKTGASSGNDLVMVKIFGHIAAIEANSDIDLGKSTGISPIAAMGLAMSEPVFVAKARVTCTCETTGSCKHESEWGVHWCDATTCSSCSMDY